MVCNLVLFQIFLYQLAVSYRRVNEMIIWYMVYGMVQGISFIDEPCRLISVKDIESTINRLDTGKSCGLDGLSVEHLLYAGKRLYSLLALLFNTCIHHGYLPSGIIASVLIPIIKDKSGDITDKGNYRPIALSSVISKVLEHILLDLMEDFLCTTDNQFGFKAKHSTDQCIYLLKEAIDFYRKHNTPMYLCFMDASKAFDRVNHWTLFRKLLLRGVPPIIVRLIVFWYRSQCLCVRWGSVTSPSFMVTNGVRQGVYSPLYCLMFTWMISAYLYLSAKLDVYSVIQDLITYHMLTT